MHPSSSGISGDTGGLLGSCTYELGLFPFMWNLVDLLEEKALKNRSLGLFGSCGWSGAAEKRMKGFAAAMSWNPIEPFLEVKRSPRGSHLEQCVQFGRNMVIPVAKNHDP